MYLMHKETYEAFEERERERDSVYRVKCSISHDDIAFCSSVNLSVAIYES